jgi:hypothetical protein
MFVAPGSVPAIGYRLTRDTARHVARNWCSRPASTRACGS